MRILMLGNSLTFSNDLPQMLAERTGAQVIYHTRGGARLSEQLNPSTRLGARTQAALAEERWDYVIMQEMSHGPITSPKSFFSSVERLCKQIQDSGAVPVLYATWAYQKDSPKLAAKGWDEPRFVRGVSPGRTEKPSTAGRCGPPLLQTFPYAATLCQRRRSSYPSRFPHCGTSHRVHYSNI